MAQTNRPTLAKRQLEAKRRARRLKKEEKRAARKAEKQQQAESPEQQNAEAEVDPDIADIVPGPQPPQY